MTDVRATTRDLLDERPELERRLEELLAVDAECDTWTFDDVEMDSGTFGELVSRDLVEKRDGEYTFRDRAAVEQTLGIGDGHEQPTESKQSREALTARLTLPDVDRVAAAGLAGALALVVLFRVLPFPSIFRNGDVVLSGNDPYYYRYLVHQMLANGGSPFDFSVLSSLPGGISHGEPLFVSALWWVSAVIGGGVTDYVLAWYPVVSAVVTALLIYVLTVRVTDDRRAGIAAVALLAIVPAHGFRTSLGFADHHAFDYPWLALTALAVVSLAGRDIRERRTWGWILALGVGVGAQTLAWDAGPLLLVPLALYVAISIPSSLRVDRSPLHAGMSLAAGLFVGSVIVGSAHVAFGWHSTVVVAVVPLLFGGTVALLALGTAARRFEVPARNVVAAEIAVAVAGLIGLRAVFPPFASELDHGINFLFSTGGIAETTSLVSGKIGTILGPILLFGFALFLAIPYLAWASLRCYRKHSPGWLLASVYAWYFFVLALVQLRFAGELALFVAFFGGLGFVHVAAWMDITDYPDVFETRSESSRPQEPTKSDELDWPERRTAMYTLGLGLGVGSFGFLMTPIKQQQLHIDDSVYRAAQFMREYADERGWKYPDNYVFSRWSRNRVYNWFVSGNSKSYGYAQANYEDFIASTDGEQWYDKLRKNAGFVVTGDGLSIDTGGQTIYEQLWSENVGLETDHYRAVWTNESDSRRIYTLVPGARITGPLAERSPVTIDGTCTIGGQSRSITIRHSSSDPEIYDLTVPLPGTYTIGDRTITVSEEDVTTGARRSAFDGEYDDYWSFEVGHGETAYDRDGGRHATITNGSWVEGVEGSAISFDGSGYAAAVAMDGTTDAFTVSAWIKPSGARSGAILSTGKDGGAKSKSGILFDHGQSGWLDDRLGLYVGDGESTAHAHSPRLGLDYPTESYHHVAVTFEQGTIRWYLDGEQIGEETIDLQRIAHPGDTQTYIGRERSNFGGVGHFNGSIDELLYDETALDAGTLADLP